MLAKPNHAAVVASVVAGWSAIEAHLGRVFATLTSSKHPVVMNMFDAARGFDVQRDLLLAAAKSTLPATHYAIFALTVTVVGRASHDRNVFAHSIWGFSTDPNLDALLMIEAEHLRALTRRRMRHRNANKWKPGDLAPSYYFTQMPSLSRDDIKVYQMKDLENVRERIERAFQFADALLDLCIARTGPERRQVLQWLRSTPEIQKEAAKKNSNPQSKPSSRSGKSQP